MNVLSCSITTAFPLFVLYLSKIIELFSSLQVIFNFWTLNFLTSSKILLILSLWVSNSFVKFNDLCEMRNSNIYHIFTYASADSIIFSIWTLFFFLFHNDVSIWVDFFDLIFFLLIWYSKSLFVEYFVLGFFPAIPFSWPFCSVSSFMFLTFPNKFHMFWFLSCLRCLCLGSSWQLLYLYL